MSCNPWQHILSIFIGILYQITAADIGKNTLYGNIENNAADIARWRRAPNITDCNSATDIGNYTITASTTNRPCDYALLNVDVNTGGGWVVQTATNVLNLRRYYRVKNGANWTAWTEVASIPVTFSKNFTTQPGYSYQYPALSRCGKLVSVQFNLVSTGKYNYQSVLSGMPVPVDGTKYVGIVGSSSGGTTTGLIAITSSGEILVSTDAAGSFFINFVYIANNSY